MKKYSKKELDTISGCDVILRFPPQDGEKIKEIKIPINDLQTLLIQLAAHNHKKITGDY